MDLKLKSAGEMINHLITWGEVTRFELSGIVGAQEWITTFENAGILHTAITDIWSLSPEFWSLLREESEKAVRTALFQVPEYRGYLISILAEGAASAAKQGLNDEVEKWSGDELLPFLSAINRMLNEIETDGKRIIDQKADQIPALFAKLSERQNNWDNWNQTLLGRTARPQDLFDFVLKRFVPYAMPEPCNAHGLTPALLPIIPLVDADGNAQFMHLVPAPWNVRRSDIQSGIALFDEHGKPMGDMGTADAARNALQDALIEQPFYKAVIQLAINHYRAKTASSPSFELVLQPGAGLSGVALFYETRKMGLLKDWLPPLVQCQECFAARPLEESQVENMMENLLALDILDQADDNLVLHEDFQSTLMAGRLRSVFRPGKALQERMKELVVRRENEKKTEVRSEEEYRRIFTHKILTPNSSILTSSKVALPKLFLWNDPTRYQEYPEALALAEEDRVYTRQEIEQELFDITPTLTFKKDGKPRGRGTDGIVNAMGFERLGRRLCVNGLDLIRKTDHGFVVSEAGLKLGNTYKNSAESDEWLHLLAKNLLLREPRTRLLIGLMLKGWLLQVDVFNKFPKSQMSFIGPEQARLDITSKDCWQFNALLSEHAELALGPLWIAELSEHGLSLPIEWCGIRVDQPSIKDLSSAIKKSFGLLFYIGIFSDEGNGWAVDTDHVGRMLGYDVLESFGVSASGGQGKSKDELFLEALRQTMDGEGYAIASALADKFGELCQIPVEEREEALDQFAREAMYDDRLVIESYHTGQPRMGRGLFGNQEYRRLKLEVWN